MLGIGLQEFGHIYDLDRIVDAWLFLLFPQGGQDEGKKQIQLVMKLVEGNPVQLIMNEKSLVEHLRIYGSS